MSHLKTWINNAERIPEKFRARWTETEVDKAREVLLSINSIFTRHGIPWCLICGSLLGAVRHGGVIPWDDDIDITVHESLWPWLLGLAPWFHSAGLRIRQHEKDLTIVIQGQENFPFIDVFPWRASQDGKTIHSMGHKSRYYVDVPLKDWWPFCLVPFEGGLLPSPAHPEVFLNGKYPGWATTVDAGAWDHRRDKPLPKDMRGTMPWEELQRLVFASGGLTFSIMDTSTS